MTDPDPELSDNERELWAATIAQLREHAEDPRAEQGLDGLAAQILAEHRASARVEPIARPRRRSGRVIAIACLAAAAAIAVIVLATRREEDPVPQADRTSPEPRERVRPIEPIPEPARVGPPLDQAGLLALRRGPVERTTEVAVAIEPGAIVEPGATLSTAIEGETCVRWTAPFALVCVDGNARVELLAAESSTRRVRLHAGRLIAVLDPLAVGQTFEVTTSLGSVAAIGTVFVVEVGEVAIDASVFEGEVEIRDAQGVRRLRADQSLQLGAGVRPGSLDADVRVQAESVSARAALWRGPIESMGVVAFDSSARAVDLDGHPLDSGSLALLLSAGAHQLRVGEDSELELDIVAGEREALGELPTSKPSAPIEPSAAELARLAQQHRMARNYAETARIYRELIDRYPESPEATHAPVRLGDLLLKTGDHQGALAAYDLYLERGGQLEPEARFGRIKTLRALDRQQAEAAAITEFLREHPDDYRVTELTERSAELE
jgi:ferric-dicitrate binding protein FerR (iron transport regulator)